MSNTLPAVTPELVNKYEEWAENAKALGNKYVRCTPDEQLSLIARIRELEAETAGLTSDLLRSTEALHILADAVGRYQAVGPLKGVRADLEKGLALSYAVLDPDLGRIKPGHVCKHGIRWPHACDECDADALALRDLITKEET
jgi:hypothetical protein